MDQTEALKRFERKSKRITAALLATGILCLASVLIFERRDSLIGLLISLAALVIWFVALCVIATRINDTRLRLERACASEKPTGLFRELMEEFEWNQFEGLTDGKVIFAEVRANTIELELCRKKRTIHIVIDPGAVLVVIDEESAAPKEIELYLSDYTDVSQLFTAIRATIEQP